MTAPIIVTAPVTEATLLEDRAQVTREGRVRLSAGRHELRLASLAPVVSDKTVVVRIVGPAGEVRVLDAVVRRESRITRRERTEGERELRDRLHERQNELMRLRTEHGLAIDEMGRLGELTELTLGEFGDDTSWGRAPREQWGEHLERLRERNEEARERHARLGFDLTERLEEIGRLESRLRQLAVDAGTTRTATLCVDTEVSAAGEYAVRIDYVVPGACWRPYHTACLAASGDSVVFECTACVWQNTGEEWTNATLRFSTLRPSLGTRPPRLSTDRLAARKKAPEVEVEAREQTIHTTGLGAGETADELPGIDDGGDPVALTAPRPATVPSDGRPCRVPLFSFETKVDTELVAAAEFDACAHLKSTQTNAAPHPILAGPVDLIREGGPVGRTTVLFVAPGESFPLGWGPDPDLRVRRTATSSDEEKSLTGAWLERVIRVVTDVSNIGTTEKELELVERIPVSEIEPVQIALDQEHTSDGSGPDADGFVRFSVRVAPDEHATREVRYVVRRHRKVKGLFLGVD